MSKKSLPRFRSHKIVEAVKIHEFIQQATACYLVPEDRAVEPFEISAEYIERCKPKAGGYYVRYADGFESWSPAEAFEEGYTRVGFPTTSGLSFGQAIDALKAGQKVSRAGWNGKGMWLVLVPGTPQAQLGEGTPYREALGQETCQILPHIDMWTTNAEGRRAMQPGWQASQTDALAEDWGLVT